MCMKVASGVFREVRTFMKLRKTDAEHAFLPVHSEMFCVKYTLAVCVWSHMYSDQVEIVLARSKQAPPLKPGSAQGFFMLVRELFLATVALGLL